MNFSRDKKYCQNFYIQIFVETGSVSEGTKTESNYFKDIRAAYRLQKANIGVQPDGVGTGPI
jgi:hypothetical protein